MSHLMPTWNLTGKSLKKWDVAYCITQSHLSERLKGVILVHFLWHFWTYEYTFQPIADGAVTKRHQWLDKLRIIFTCSPSRKLARFSKTLSCSIRSWHLTQSIRKVYACALPIMRTAYTRYKYLRYWQKNSFANSSILLVKNIKISSCRWWCFLLITSVIILTRHLRNVSVDLSTWDIALVVLDVVV